MISTGIVRSIDSLGRVSCPRNSAPPTILLRIPRWRFLPMGIPSLCASTTRRAAAFSAATFLPTPCCSTANTSAPSAARHWASKARSSCYIPAYTKKACAGELHRLLFLVLLRLFQPAHGFLGIFDEVEKAGGVAGVVAGELVGAQGERCRLKAVAVPSSPVRAAARSPSAMLMAASALRSQRRSRRGTCR